MRASSLVSLRILMILHFTQIMQDISRKMQESHIPSAVFLIKSQFITYLAYCLVQIPGKHPAK